MSALENCHWYLSLTQTPCFWLGKWREDSDSTWEFGNNYKINARTNASRLELTFIILARANLGTDPESMRQLPMIGDVNLFLKDVETDDGDRKEAEIEIMIAGLGFVRLYSLGGLL